MANIVLDASSVSEVYIAGERHAVHRGSFRAGSLNFFVEAEGAGSGREQSAGDWFSFENNKGDVVAGPIESIERVVLSPPVYPEL